MDMKFFLTTVFTLICSTLFAANPSFDSFNTNDFTHQGNSNVRINTNRFIPISDLRANNVLTIDNNSGDDTRAATAPYMFPWSTVFNIWNTNSWQPRGAIAYSKPGDWIYFMPSSNAYYVPQIPLNYFGPSTNGLNLIVPAGVTIIRTNYGNTNASQFTADTAAGPLIMPGNSSITIINGILYATNGTQVVYGYNTGNLKLPGIPTNYVATNLYLGGFGEMHGSYDVIVCQAANGQGRGSATFENLRLFGNYDQINNTFFDYITRNIYAESSGGFNNNNTDARGLVINDGYYADYGSTFLATASTNNANATCGVDLSQTTQTNTLYFNGTTVGFKTNPITGLGTNMFAVRFGLRSGTLSGQWTELTPTSHTSVASSPYKITTAFNADTNTIITTGAGTANANGTWTWTTDRYLLGSNWISNDAPSYIVMRTGPGSPPQPKYFSTNGYLGPYWATNTGVAPGPTAINPTNTVVTRTAL
jgi:hypothetical protein